ncbi:type VI secretion system ATPase TssH [Candidatus Odyssella acanthamoebae]|uniref:type VI secretion system ATPase TssH n=1 Tax=Candidatus Odyssella acanthamoebae TaxID=91604 RepID=UPI00056F7067|nr:type VI secretion system ATPase TssH [Candidatus Paracaedibacter acanthamoebae]
MATEMKNLVSKLNHPSKRALEGAAALCVTKTNYNVEIEHFIYKLLEQAETDVRQILRQYDVDIDSVKRYLLGAIDKFKTGCTGTPVLSPNVLMVLEHAWSIASLRINQSSIRTAALMLALIDVDQIRGIILESCPLILRIPRHTLRQDLDLLLKASPENRYSSVISNTIQADSVGLEMSVKAEGEALQRFATNLNELVVAGKMDPVCGREKEVSQLVDILSRRRQNNPILVGEAGVGKTAIVEGLAQRIVGGSVPASLESAQIYSLDLGLLQAGAGMKGEFEDRLNQVINDVKQSPLPIILFIDEAHTLIGAGGTAGTGDAANLLKPALARGELRVIAATTWSEYKRHIEGDAALTRRFEQVKVTEPSLETSGMILRYLVPSLERHHKVEILNEAIEAAVHLSQRFLQHRRLPDKAINLLDTTSARVAVVRKGKPAEMETLENRHALVTVELEMLRRETKGGTINQQRYGQLEQELKHITAEIQSLTEKWHHARLVLDKVDSLQSQPSLPSLGEQPTHESELQALHQQLNEAFDSLGASYKVDRRAVAQVLSSWTGVPVSTMLSYHDGLKKEDVFQKLKDRVIGQDYGLQRIAQNILAYSAGMADPHKPMGVFLLAGPSGVGKTETAQALADVLTGSVDNLIRINLSEFQEPHTVATLKGAPPGYVGYGKGGVLTEAVRRNPYSVILLDEVEKAHPDVMNLFYQIFDKGQMEDGEGVEVSFQNCLIILTSNIGAEVISDFWERNSGQVDQEFFSTVEPKLWLALNKRFAHAFLARTTVIPYAPLGFGELARITRLKLSEIDARLKQQHQADLIVVDADIQRIIEISQSLQQGARAIDKVLSSQILPKLSERLLKGDGIKEMRLADI